MLVAECVTTEIKKARDYTNRMSAQLSQRFPIPSEKVDPRSHTESASGEKESVKEK